MQTDAQAWSRQISLGRLLWMFDSSHEFSLSFCLCVLSVRATDSELSKVESRLHQTTKNPCYSLENRWWTRVGAFISPVTTTGVVSDYHSGSQTFDRLSLCNSESCGKTLSVFGWFLFIEPFTRQNYKSFWCFMSTRRQCSAIPDT